MSRRQTEEWLSQGIYTAIAVHVADGDVTKMAFRESGRVRLGALAGAHAEIAVIGAGAGARGGVSLVFGDGTCHQVTVRGASMIGKAQAEVVRFNLAAARAAVT